jgi:hypothetical protein
MKFSMQNITLSQYFNVRCTVVAVVWVNIDEMNEAPHDVYVRFSFMWKLGSGEKLNLLPMSASTKHVRWLCASLLRKLSISIQTSSPRGSYWWDLANLFVRYGRRTGPVILPTGTSYDIASCYSTPQEDHMILFVPPLSAWRWGTKACWRVLNNLFYIGLFLSFDN